MQPEPPSPVKPQPERALTDESLRAERSNTDQVIAERRIASEETADLRLEEARRAEDATVTQAREEADAADVRSPIGSAGRGDVVEQRAIEDAATDRARIAADDIMQAQREDEARALASLLPLEREKTDRHLLTERVRSDDTLAQRDDFLAMVSHDLRNLLSGVLWSSSALIRAASDSEEGRRTVAGMQRIERYVARMNRLVGDLVDVVSIEAGKLAMGRTRNDAAALIAEAVDAFTVSAVDKGISLTADVRHAPLVGEFDHGRMLQVLANLITNALKFTPRGGSIEVRGELAPGGGFGVAVADTGVGIPSDMLEAVFERFWQVADNDRRGVGLGLYISRCIVQAHGGKIWAESAVGVGTVFHVVIPGSDERKPAP